METIIFVIQGVMTDKPGGVKLEFECKTVARTLDEALDRFKEVYSPDWYQTRKVTSILPEY